MNLGKIRQHLFSYLRAHPNASHDVMLNVIQFQLTEHGIPLEAHASCPDQNLARYEGDRVSYLGSPIRNSSRIPNAGAPRIERYRRSASAEGPGSLVKLAVVGGPSRPVDPVFRRVKVKSSRRELADQGGFNAAVRNLGFHV